ncbi:Connectin-like Protein [Tribolium castaneum]|uniref:Connectin-like Protein n=1 Tax=Tribolium castaneum TaxID=7070 RepID=D6X038_TRICA|nr:Connectin-like Protein [Tribolium castaneum]
MLCALLIVLLTVKIGEACPDRWAKVDAWLHFNTEDKGEHITGKSINELDEYEMIEVTKANISTLCDGAIKNLPELRFLSLVEANISKIQPDAFQNLPLLTHLSLAVNRLTSIERYQFKNLDKLNTLYLSKNRIENVEEDAFTDLIHLRKVFLDRNKLHEIDSKWFLSNPKLGLIDLSFNDISKVQAGAFALPRNSIVEIRLQNNQVEEIEPDAVTSEGKDDGKPHLTLRLERNKLAKISEKFVQSMDKLRSSLYFDSNQLKCFDPKTLRVLKNVTVELHVDKNPIDCDCLIAATNFVEDHVLSATFYFSSTECKLPVAKPKHQPQNMFFYT